MNQVAVDAVSYLARRVIVHPNAEGAIPLAWSILRTTNAGGDDRAEEVAAMACLAMETTRDAEVLDLLDSIICVGHYCLAKPRRLG